jgi:hypothetical protein
MDSFVTVCIDWQLVGTHDSLGDGLGDGLGGVTAGQARQDACKQQQQQLVLVAATFKYLC